MKTKLLQIKTSFEVNGVQKSQIYTVSVAGNN